MRLPEFLPVDQRDTTEARCELMYCEMVEHPLRPCRTLALISVVLRD